MKRVYFFLCLLSLTLFICASQVAADLRDDVYNANVVTVEDGERCLVGGMPLTAEDVVLLVRGRRIPLSKEAVDIFRENPEQYFLHMQNRSALFSERAVCF